MLSIIGRLTKEEIVWINTRADKMVADERERCAKLVERLDDGPLITGAVRSYVAQAIRSQSEPS